MNDLEERNYHLDARTQAAARGGAKIPTAYITDEEGYDVEVELPWRWEVCPLCEGRGSHVNPSIDAGGLTADDFAEDPEFAEDYVGGTYDVPCHECGGRTTVPTVDRDACDPALLRQYDAYLRACAEDARYAAMEAAMGA